MVTLLTLLSALVAVAFFVVVIAFLARIVRTLELIGGEPTGYSSRTSYLAKLAFGLRAIEQQTSHLAPEVTRLNAGLESIAGGLISIDGHLAGTIESVVRQDQR